MTYSAGRGIPGSQIESALLSMASGAVSGTRSAHLPCRASAWRWEEAWGRAGLEALAPAWEALAARLALPVNGGPQWARCFLEAFGTKGRSFVVWSATCNGRLVAVVPLWRTGRLWRRWFAVANSHSPNVVFAVEQIPLEEIDVFLKQALKSAHVIDLRRIHGGSDLHKTLVGVARAGGFPLVEESVGSEAIIDLAGPWDAFRRAMPWNLEKTTARHLRQLRGLGDLALEVVSGGERLAPMIKECLQLETLGWKSQFGTPILSRVDTTRFYTELAAVGAPDGFVTLYGLRLNGRLIAFEYCLRSSGYIEMLKISYAPDLAHYSPGNVLRYLLLRREIELGEVKSYHMGLTSEWKRRWAVRFEPLSQVRIYDRGIAARVGYYVGPRARGLLRRCTLLVMGVRWLRRFKDRTARVR